MLSNRHNTENKSKTRRISLKVDESIYADWMALSVWERQNVLRQAISSNLSEQQSEPDDSKVETILLQREALENKTIEVEQLKQKILELQQIINEKEKIVSTITEKS